MISWLKGEKIHLLEQGTRAVLVINCSGVGYEVQILHRDFKEIDSWQELTLWVHQIIRDEGYFLFGFINQQERDLFKKLISVSGVGPQLAISLLENNDASSLISAILNKDIATLTQSPGVGKRTGERLILELKSKLSNIPPKEGSKIEFFKPELINEVKATLKNLDYKESEIKQALSTLSETYKEKYHYIDSQNSHDFESILKETLMLLSQKIGYKGT